MTLRYLHWDQVEPFSFHSRVKNFDADHRFTTIAVDKDQILGYWRFTPQLSRSGRMRINSWYTRVHCSVRSEGVARALWHLGIERWKPFQIDTTMVSTRGARFVAAMKVWCAIHHPNVFISSYSSEWNEYHERHVAQFALEALEKNAKPSRRLKHLAIVA